jgi:2,5-furandicarboxylate decarboxylase 1
MGLDATKPVRTGPLEFKRIHVKGIETVDLATALQEDPQGALARIVAD